MKRDPKYFQYACILLMVFVSSAAAVCIAYANHERAGKGYPVVVSSDFTLGSENGVLNPSDKRVWAKYASQKFTSAGGYVSVYTLKNNAGEKMKVDSCNTLFKVDADGFTNFNHQVMPVLLTAGMVIVDGLKIVAMG